MSLAVFHELISCPWKRENCNASKIKIAISLKLNKIVARAMSFEIFLSQYNMRSEKYSISLCQGALMAFHLEGSKTLVATPTGKFCITGAMLRVETRAQWEMAVIVQGPLLDCGSDN